MSNVQAVSTVAALRSLTGLVDGNVYQVSGCDVANDGGAGEFLYSASSALTADNYLVITPAGSVGGQLIRLFSGDINICWMGAKTRNLAGHSTYDSTSSINLACNSAGINNYNCGIYCPAGDYNVGAVLFGNQNVSAESSAPNSFYGDSRSSTRFFANPGFAGTMFQAWTVAGIRLANFSMTGSTGLPGATPSAAHCIDSTWQAGPGPSQQNRYEFIELGATTSTSFVAVGNNDSVFDQISCSSPSAAIAAINVNASGGLVWLRDCICNVGYLHIGSQNAVISGGWSFGIMFAQASLNSVSIEGGYQVYWNSSYNALLFSESYGAQQSVRALNCSETIFLGPSSAVSVGSGGMIDLNGYSTLNFDGCSFSSGFSVPMYGPHCRNDSYVTVQVNLRGGCYDSVVVLNEPAAYTVNYDNFLDNATGRYHPNKKASIYAAGQASLAPPYASGSYYEIVPAGTLVDQGSYLITWTWNNNGTGQPWILQGQAIIGYIPTCVAGDTSDSADIAAQLSCYFVNDGAALAFRLVGSGTTASGPAIQFKWTSGRYDPAALPSPGYVTWTATKLA